MRKTALLAIVILLPGSALAAGKKHATSHPATNPAKPVISNMLRALNKQSHISVQGPVRSGKRVVARYSLVYAAGREAVKLLSYAEKIGNGKSASNAVQYVYVGRTVYTRVNNQWYRVKSSTSPSQIDALALNTAGSSCCTTSGLRASETMRLRRGVKWNGRPALALHFQGASGTGGAYGVLYVSPTTYLPLGYTVTQLPNKLKGAFTVKYGGSFNIAIPHL